MKNIRDNVNIEFARIICSIFVIMNHCFNHYYVSNTGEFRDKVCLINTLFISAVPVFFMITGYFARPGQDYKKKLKKTVIKILIPAILLSFFTYVLYPYFPKSDSLSFWEYLKSVNLKKFGIALLGLKIDSFKYTNHLWYVVALSKIMVLYPLWSLLCSEENNEKLARRIVMLLYIVSTFYKDLKKNYPSIPNIFLINIIDRTVFFFLLGYEFSNIEISKIKNVFCILSIILSCSVIYLLTKLVYIRTGKFSDYFYHYETIPCIILSCGVFITFMKLNFKNNVLYIYIYIYIIKKGGELSYTVYLIHVLVLLYIRNVDIFMGKTSVIYLYLQGILTSIISYFIALMLKIFKDCVKFIINYFGIKIKNISNVS